MKEFFNGNNNQHIFYILYITHPNVLFNFELKPII